LGETGTFFGVGPNFTEAAKTGDLRKPDRDPVPELSLWAMLGVGLVGVAFV
jgi:hypothetical protein